MTVNEIFYSLQGEGLLTGVPSVFIRLPGCPLRCKWCDTKYAWDPTAGEDLSVLQIIDRIKIISARSNDPASPAARAEAGERRATSHECRFIVITGGEPMLNAHLPELAQKLKSRDMHITIETAGVAFTPDLSCDLMSISPKLSSSTPTDKRLASVHEKARLNIPALRQLIAHYEYQLKFVVESPDDLPEIQNILDKIGNVHRQKVLLMPQAQTRDELIAKSPAVAELCKRTGFTFCHRLQIILWDNARGK